MKKDIAIMDDSLFENMTFEEAYNQLAMIVQQLETSNVSLNESMDLFEKGQHLAVYCQQLLDGAELRISQLMDGDVATE